MSTRRPAPALEDRLLLDDLYSEYLWALDTGDVEIYIGTFWDDAVLKEDQLDGSTEVFETAEVIREYTAAHFDDWTGHQHRETTRLYLPAEGRADRWRAQSYWFASHRDAPTNHVEFTSTGYYRDVVEKRDGQWRFLERHIARWPGALPHPYRT